MPGSSSDAFAAGVPSPGAIDGVLRGDFDANGVLDVNDINLLLTELRSNAPAIRFDLSGDGNVNTDDRDFLVETLLGTSYGDSNLDGIFNSNDLVLIFQAGQYEDDIAGNSTWETGDWNGDGDFTTFDLVTAFRRSKYVAE